MRGSRRRALVIGALVLAVAAFWAPSFIAARYTDDAVPIEVVGHPIRGWQFLVDAVQSSRSATAGTEGHARGIAERHWWTTRVHVERLQLVYTDGRTVTIPVARGGLRRSLARRTVRVRTSFVWFVHGSIGRRPRQVVGLINMRTGRVIWDILRPRISPA